MNSRYLLVVKARLVAFGLTGQPVIRTVVVHTEEGDNPVLLFNLGRDVIGMNPHTRCIVTVTQL